MNNDFISRFKCYDKWVDEETFINAIFDELKNHPFSDHNFIAFKLSSNPNHVKEAMKDGIIKYYKENPGMIMREVCRNLNVRSIYIEELCNENRLEIIGSELEDLKVEFVSEEEKATIENNDFRKRSAIMGLNNLSSSFKNNEINNQSNNRGGFHSNVLNDDSKGFRKR